MRRAPHFLLLRRTSLRRHDGRRSRCTVAPRASSPPPPPTDTSGSVIASVRHPSRPSPASARGHRRSSGRRVHAAALVIACARVRWLRRADGRQLHLASHPRLGQGREDRSLRTRSRISPGRRARPLLRRESRTIQPPAALVMRGWLVDFWPLVIALVGLIVLIYAAETR
jgi:hypothetical protein